MALAVGYGVLLASLPAEGYKDRNNYLGHATYSSVLIERYLERGWLPYLSNEPLWLHVNSVLSNFFYPEQVVRILIFCGAATTATYVLRNTDRRVYWCVLILFLAPLLKNYVIHLRQGFAIAIFLTGVSCTKTIPRYSILALAPFAHSSFAFVSLLYFSVDAFKRIGFSAPVRLTLYAALAIALAAAFGVVAGSLGARQAETDIIESGGGSGLGMVMWMLVLFAFVAEGKHFQREHAFAIAMVTTYVCSYFLIAAAPRIFESGIVLVLLACMALTGNRFRFVAAILIFYFALTSFSRFMLPSFGWQESI